MTLKTSLFNKGIYKSTVRRYMWGSILYFIFLFLTTGLMIMLNENPEIPNVYWSARAQSVLLSTEYMVFPMLLSIAVPTAAGLMIFRFIHSKKASVFTHSLPVKRSANYISAVLAALTLMAIPVILNTAILVIMSLVRYELLFSVTDCLVWMLLNFFSLFVFFSCVCFVSVITGNSFAMLGLNVIFHTVSLIFAAVFTVISEAFLHGFAGEDTLLQKTFERSFITRIPTMMMDWIYASGEALKQNRITVIIFISSAIVLYAVSGLLYSKRRMETAEDVAGFKCLNLIFKQLVTFIGAVSAFALFLPAIYRSSAVMWIGVIIVSAVVYFGAEMLLRKTLRVWRSYKGFVAFLAAFAVIISAFAFTSFFGFETFLPDISEVENVAVYSFYHHEKPFVSNEEVISKAIMEHNSLIKASQVIVPEEYDTRIHIEYELKNGKTVHRAYRIDEELLYEIMDSLYENEEYKEKCIAVYAHVEKLLSATLQSGGNHIEFAEEKAEELIECIKKDLKMLSYGQINNGGWNVGVEFRYVAKKEKTEEKSEYTEPSDRINYMHQTINMNFENTVKWIKDNGYWESVFIKNEGQMYIAKNWEYMPFTKTNENNVEKNFLKIEKGEDFDKIIDFIENYKPGYVPEEQKLRLYHSYSAEDKDYSMTAEIPIDELKKLFPDKQIDKLIE